MTILFQRTGTTNGYLFAFSFPPHPGLFQPLWRAGRDRDRVSEQDGNLYESETRT